MHSAIYAGCPWAVKYRMCKEKGPSQDPKPAEHLPENRMGIASSTGGIYRYTMNFYQIIAEYYDDIFPLSQRQVEFVQRHLSPSSDYLDLGCATGSLTITLAALGHPCIGVDLSADLLTIARKKINDCPNSIRLEQMDMMHISSVFPANEFDAVGCFGNTLSHLPPQQVPALLSAVKNVLKPGGFFFIQIVNYDRLVKKGLSTLPTIENTAIRFERKYLNFDGNSPFTFEATLTVHHTGDIHFVNETLYPMRQSELTRQLSTAGFTDVEYFGNYTDAPPGSEYLPLIAMARMR
jgi:glycine/sarcosine N-methyltransferase